MIIYTKKDAAIIIPCGLGPSVCLQTKTVDSSTVLQHIEPDSGYYGLSSVTVNPYTLDAKTVNSSTAQQVITSSVDGLSSVTVNPYTVESDSSTLTANGTYTFTPTSADALSSVTVDVSVNNWIEEVREGRLTDISGYSIAELAKKQYGAAGLFMGSSITNLPRIQDSVDNPNSDVNFGSLRQTFYNCGSLRNVDMSIGRIGRYGMYQCFSQSSVRDVSINVNEMDSNGAFTFATFAECFRNSPYLRNLYINLGPDASIAGFNAFIKMCYNVCNSSNENYNTTITIEGLKEVYFNALFSAFSEMHANNSGGITVNLPDNLSTIRGTQTNEAFGYICSNSHLTGKTTPSFFGKLDYINGERNCYHAFSYTDVETATLGFNTCIGGNNFNYAFNGCNNLKSVTFDGSFNITGQNNFYYTFNDCPRLTSITCTSTAGTKPFRDKGYSNVANSATNITDVAIDNVNSDVCLFWNPSVNAASVYGILSKAAGATIQEGDTRIIGFYKGGLTVTDYSDGRIQTAYNAAVADGWTINYLTILPYSNS